MFQITRDYKELITPCQDWDFSKKIPNPHDFAKEMIETMYDANGIGLAANQCGFLLRCFVMRGHPADYACFNPRIVGYSSEKVELEEGCLSFPGMIIKVERARDVRVRFADYNGEVSTHTFTGMTARVFQHELDHLNGILFYNLTDSYHREKAFKDAKKANKLKERNRVRKLVDSGQ